MGYMHQCTIVGNLFRYHHRYAKRLVFAIAIGNELLVPWLKNVQVELFARKYHNPKGKYGDEIGQIF
jgi:hypothetical protein